MDKETIKEVSYMDKPYTQKRKILRRQHFINKNILEITNEVLYKVLKRVKPNEFVDYNEIIRNILVDGYIAFEKIYDSDKFISLIELDSTSLTISIDDDGQVMWHQYKGTNKSRILYESQILYIKSPFVSYTSLVEMIYVNMIDKDSKYTLKQCVNDVVDCYNENFLNLK